MNTPANVPRITDVRFAGWDERDPSIKQLVRLRALLHEEGVDAAELYGDGFTAVDHLSRWGAHWGISYLSAAQEARYVEGTRRYVERENERVREEQVKALMGEVLRRA